MARGWHWSKVIDPLADPGARGDDPAEAFEVIVPSVPGFGFFAPLPENPDINFRKGGRGSSAGTKMGSTWRLVLALLAVRPMLQPGLPPVALVRLTTPFGGEIRPGRGRWEIILFG
jgi:hypothetical protein